MMSKQATSTALKTWTIWRCFQPTRLLGWLPAAEPFDQAPVDRVVLERILADDDLGRGLERGGRLGAAGHLAQAGDAVVRHDLDDRAQRVRRVQPGRVEQRRVGDGDRGDSCISVMSMKKSSSIRNAFVAHPCHP